MREVGYGYKAPRYLSHIDKSSINRGKKRKRDIRIRVKDKDKIKGI